MLRQNRGKITAKGRRFALVVSRFNDLVSQRLLDGALECLYQHDAKEDLIEVYWVPGAFEVPVMAKKIAQGGRFDGILCLGAVIRGDTPHFDYLASEITKGIMLISLEFMLPVTFGIVTAETTEQAMERAGGKLGNRGRDAAMTNMELIDLLSYIPSKK
ncbi:6,7-dimethyl-8-ribityllumazine synthase [candidate division TA06 bacterium DG_26]|uniref:6,7-dimethyl-8-ribityllumazine synthase n=1 Tax=candidate division TA06 bacterium DG_26 TaxID=1703771 RepID=A0A0S7WMJ0_UNCT6|nr:MAG: 6,7-dimethyl-8-ribityllumazine synthase [candidate division TA06 bacterium DG_26]